MVFQRISRFIVISIIAIITTCSSTINKVDPYKKGTITMTITGIGNRKGQLRIVVFDEYGKEGFNKGYGAISAIIIPAALDDDITLSLPDLPYGKYAVLIHHDENGNGKLDTNRIGLPREGVGLSNNRGISWELAFFKIESATHTVSIKIAYPQRTQN